jgi:Glyoxalase-like domain
VAARRAGRTTVTFPQRGRIQITFDAHDPIGLATFWAEVLRYPPPDLDEMRERLRAASVPERQLDNWMVIGDPEGVDPRLFFQKVPEGKTAKNRVHLDVRASMHKDRAAIDDEVTRLIKLGGRKLQAVEDFDSYFVVMQDPEGNEFCID